MRAGAAPPWVVAFVATLGLVGAAPASGQVVRGVVVDAVRGAPLGEAVVTPDRGASVRTDRAGNFSLPVASPEVRLVIRRPGYVTWEGAVPVAEGEVLIFPLDPDPFRVGGLEVRSRTLGGVRSLQPTTVLSEEDLGERMATSVAAMLVGEPGVTVRTNGPMATQPVIRGLSGDRVLVLEDGLRTGDISTTAPDHAVTIEPATARQVEVVRGPAGLLYGSNSLGGVVNVRREDVPRRRPEGTEWSLASYGESVNRGGSGSGRIARSLGPLSFQADAAYRSTGDTRTPGGTPLPFTDVEAFDGGVGGGWVGPQGHLGAAGRVYRSGYGVPSSFQGMTLPGSHDGGVYIDVHRASGRLDGEWRPQRPGRLEAVAGGANAVRFEQWEYEQGGFVGTRFGQLSASGDVVVRGHHGRHRGAMGIAGQWRDLRAEGSFTGTRPARQRTLAVFGVDEIDLGRGDLLLGVRLDHIGIVPLDSTETLLVRDVRTRRFTAATGAVGVRVPLAGGWTASLQVARSFRPPSIEELFSAGPHLASYAYEIGVPSLEPEIGLGVDAVLRRDAHWGRVELAAFAMAVDDFIAFAPRVDSTTGLPLRDPRLRRYVVYAPEQADARLSGLEARMRATPAEGWAVDLGFDLVRGRQADGSPLPGTPPPSARMELRRFLGGATLAVHLDGRGPQRRVPLPPPGADATCVPQVEGGEVAVLPALFCPTSGVLLVGGLASMELGGRMGMPRSTRVSLAVENLFDRSWRDPLWRAKQVAPQPGRNVRLGAQVRP